MKSSRMPLIFGELACFVCLLACATTVAIADSQHQLLACNRQDACYCEAMPSRSFQLFCSHQLSYTFRISYTAPRADQAAAFLIWCDPITMKRDHFQQLYSYNLTLGPVESVVFHLCPLPEGTLEDFFDRVGITDVQLFKVFSLDLYNDTMPKDFLHGINITSLQLNSVSNIQLDADFFKSTADLQNLTIIGSSLTLPYNLFRHTPRLRQLGLTNNNLKILPLELFDGLHHLSRLSLGNNRLNNLTGRHFRDLAMLHQLDLYKNHIRTLSDSIFSPLESLETLHMSLNPLQSLQEKLFEGTPNLRKLELNGDNRNPNLSRPPAGLFRGLTKLEVLTMDKLKIQELPEGLFDGLTSLKNLTLDHNELRGVPIGTFASLRRLMNLDLSWNQMTEVPSSLLAGLHQLDTIYLNSNKLKHLPYDMFTATPKLERLFLHNNSISEVRVRTFSGIGSTLRLLTLNRNRIALSDSALISPAFQELVHLQRLDLSHNQISFLTQDMLSNLLNLKYLNLRFNQLQSISFHDLNFLTWNAKIDMRYNNISRIAFPLASQMVEGNSEREPNTFNLLGNPINCDCSVLSLKAYLDHTGAFKERDKLDELFLLANSDEMRCVHPERLRGSTLAGLSADQFLCPLQRDCPEGCVCHKQSSTRTVLVKCGPMPGGRPLPTNLPKTQHGYMVNMHLENSSLRRLSNLSMTSSPIGGLFLSYNNLAQVPVEHLPPELRTLRLDHNRMKTFPSDLVHYLNRSRTQVSLGYNPYICNCELQELQRFVQLDGREGFQQVLDPGDIFCAEQNKTLLQMLPEELCPGVAAAVIAVCVVATALGMCVLVISIIFYNYSETIKVWLYARRWCMCWVSEAEIDAEKKYDAFLSYSHLDESFIVEELVPKLERGDPQYKLCLHFRDWQAGEWITDQIQRSVQDSRRVIVVMSENYIKSEWGRLEFLAAHKQALNDKTNRVIVVVYGDLPAPESMDPEVKMYINMNTYLKWGDALFWERLRYALPHKGRQLKRRGRRRLTTDKLGLIIRETSSAGSTPTVTPTTGGLPPATNTNISIISNGNVNGNGIITGHLNSCFVPDKLGTINESRLREQLADNVV